MRREGLLEVFIAPDGVEWVRAAPTEAATLIYTSQRGAGDLRLIERSASRTARRIERKARRERRAMKARGYA